MKRRSLKPWHGLVFFLLVMASFFLICVPMQMYWGMFGLAATELLLLLLALGFAKLMGYPLKVLFPVKRPGALPLLGTFVLWISAYLLMMVLMLVQYRMFPIEMTQVSNGMNSMISSVPFLLSVLITAVLPAVCEEVVHRGVIIHTLYSIRREWLVVLLMGLYFGFFHSDPLRFLPTAILGAVMSYIMLETENMVYSSFFHFVNNIVPLLLTLLLAFLAGGMSGMEQQMAAQETISMIPIATIGLYTILAAPAPFGIYLGNFLIHHQKGVQRRFIPEGQTCKTILWIVIPTVILLGVGVLLIIYGILFDPVFKELLRNAMWNMMR